MEYKKLYHLQKTSFIFDNDINGFTNQLTIHMYDQDDNILSQKQSKLNYEESKNKLTHASVTLNQVYLNKQYEHIHKVFELFDDLSFVDEIEIHSALVRNGTFVILTNLINTENIDSNDLIVEQNTEEALSIVLKMVQQSVRATYEFFKLRIIDIIALNDPSYSAISKNMSMYIISNIIKDIDNDKFLAFLKFLLKEAEHLKNGDNQLNWIFGMIERNHTEKNLCIAAFHLIFAICYKISCLPVSDLTSHAAVMFIQKIYDDYLEECHEPKARYELYRAVYNLCYQFPSFTGTLFNNKEKLLPFINNFRSSNESAVVLSLNFFGLLYSQAPNEKYQFDIINAIPWGNLLIKWENESLSWNSVFLQIIDHMSVNPMALEIFWNQGIFNKLISHNNTFSMQSRITICQTLINIINRIPPNECLKFIQNGIYELFFDILEFDSCQFVETVLDCMHIMNEKMKTLGNIQIIVDEYMKNDAVSILQCLDKLEDKAKTLCIEIGLLSENE
ncbi:hypothetical protein TRFO_17375 [Tritrichomonas foetus]|uniref:Uncharacterized protein n=1 Tax=Tritrichomonas foetus TaxID=1144522 RepID=A0A1J4KSV4_9EUKA|nr:hypothetical protein TRFO_17375 [Tritrichomonas foetus]|eukprot:OHT12742.1 hypothetical protein TRFO_17375 [Tritrichomonas foetus]